MSLIKDLLHTPPALSKSAAFTKWNGVFYMLAGAMMLVWPASVQIIFRDPAFQGNEAALFRVIGMCVAVIGWFYFFGGRAGARQIAAASVVDRMILVPVVLIPLAIADVFPHVLLTFAILDPILGAITWHLLRRDA